MHAYGKTHAGDPSFYLAAFGLLASEALPTKKPIREIRIEVTKPVSANKRKGKSSRNHASGSEPRRVVH